MTYDNDYASFVKMSTKLVVHRFEKGINFKSLHIVIEQNDNGMLQTKFGKWVEGKVDFKNKDIEKSRLVVKTVSDDDASSLGLDVCAIAIENFDDGYKLNVLNNDFNEKVTDNDYGTKVMSDKKDRYIDNDLMPIQLFKDIKQSNITKINNLLYSGSKSHRLYNYSSPLEYSLEKVKENNARIMENIHMLNRTLNYTKKKEILDMINPKPLHSYPCNECGKCFVYETGLRRHFFIRHGSVDTQPRWQTVWTCSECFQVWPRQDVAIQHSNQCCQGDNADFVQEIKTSLLLQCEFCEKTFTSIPRLLGHSKNHTIKSNYECSACNINFPSYKSAEQHWLHCPWLQLSYKFSLPKMLLCNACDRKFRSYDQLYNHRYKLGHFMSKINDEYNAKNVLRCVYQCEICSQWFKETAALESHRNLYHPNLDTGLVYNFETHSLPDSYQTL